MHPIPRHWISASKKALKTCNIKSCRVVALAIGPNGAVILAASNRRGVGFISDRSYHAEEWLVRQLVKKRIEPHLVHDIVTLKIGKKSMKRIFPCQECNNIINKYYYNYSFFYT